MQPTMAHIQLTVMAQLQLFVMSRYNEEDYVQVRM